MLVPAAVTKATTAEVRSLTYDPRTDSYVPGPWLGFSFVKLEPTSQAATLTDLSATSSPDSNRLTVNGQLQDDENLVGRLVRVKLNGVVTSVLTDSSGAFRVELASVPSGEYTLLAWPQDWNYDKECYEDSEQKSLSVTHTVPTAQVAKLVEVSLLNNTSSTSGVSANSTVAGHVTRERGLQDATVQMDADGDGNFETATRVVPDKTDAAKGRFVMAPETPLPPGEHTVAVRTVVPDDVTGTPVIGEISQLTFTVQEPQGQPPTLAAVELVNDTGESSSDGKTHDPTFRVKVSAEGTSAGLVVQVDTPDENGDFDGIPDSTFRTNAFGESECRPEGLPFGKQEMRFRVVQQDGSTERMSDWKSVPLELLPNPNPNVAIGSLWLTNDTGTSRTKRRW